MAEDSCAACPRSLGPTLVAAASTLVLYVLTGMGPVRSTFRWNVVDFKRYAGEFLQQVAEVLYYQLMPFIMAAVETMYVRHLRKRLIHKLKVDAEQLDVEYVTTMALCPIFIKLPANANVGYFNRGLVIRDRSYMERLDTLEHCFIEDDHPAAAHPDGAARKDGDPHADHPADAAPEDFHYFELQSRSSRHMIEWLFGGVSLKDRFKQREELLLALKTPSQSLKQKLEFARDKGRSVFPNLVRALQAVGYLWSILERKVQQEELSPLEVAVAFLSLVVLLQMLLEVIFAYCAQYSRVLVLHLSQRQFY